MDAKSNLHPIFQDIFKQFGMITEPETKQIYYRGWFIEPADAMPQHFGMKYQFSQDEGEQIFHAYTIEEAKDAIDEMIMEAKPKHVVIYGDRRVKEFDWLYEAYKFARMFDGDLRPNGQLILNP